MGRFCGLRVHFAALSIALGASALGCNAEMIATPEPGAPDDGPAPKVRRVRTPGYDCGVPDVLVVLDRTTSMRLGPDGSFPDGSADGFHRSKWNIAINALEGLTVSLQQNIRFGLELFPRENDGCVTMAQRASGAEVANPMCEWGEVLVSPQEMAAGDIAASIDVERTVLCQSSPIAGGLRVAGEELDRIWDQVRGQYVVLITDGQDTCDGRAGGSPITAVQDLAERGISTYVIGFSSPDGIDRSTLNHMACAGMTAAGFPSGCLEVHPGRYIAADADTAQLFMAAEDAQSLDASLDVVANKVCCGCLI